MSDDTFASFNVSSALNQAFGTLPPNSQVVYIPTGAQYVVLAPKQTALFITEDGEMIMCPPSPEPTMEVGSEAAIHPAAPA